eukprot:6477309-Amphidinium_carterae.1
MQRRVNRRSGGWLLACSGTGFVLEAMEFLGGESLTQRAAFLALCVQSFPCLQTFVHDDACHLRKFMDHWFPDCPRLRWPQMTYIVDKLHARGHVDEWCRENCHPNLPAHQQLLEEANTSTCETLFTWFSGYKPSFRHMNRATARFFVNELLDLRNSWMLGDARSSQQTVPVAAETWQETTFAEILWLRENLGETSPAVADYQSEGAWDDFGLRDDLRVLRARLRADKRDKPALASTAVYK